MPLFPHQTFGYSPRGQCDVTDASPGARPQHSHHPLGTDTTQPASVRLPRRSDCPRPGCYAAQPSASAQTTAGYAW